ncbi:MAG: hypothetical protein M3Y90_16460 [Actinomycetota bacterium]|nr:hypothetical protein [Actinomycetota bacterium]
MPRATSATAIPVGLTSGTAGTGGTAPLGDIGTLSPDVNAPELGGLGALTPAAGTPDPTSSLPLGDNGGLSPVNGDGFTIGDTTFNPVQADGSEGFTPLSPLFSAPPLFQVAEGDQSFDITSGSGTDATDLGNVTASENVTNLFGGIHNTQFTITDVDPASGASASDLPTVGTVYDVMNFGNGFANIYTDVPGAEGAANSITDTLVTPFGDFDIPTDFDAAGLLDPGDAFSGVASLGADAAGDAADAAGGAAVDVAGGAADAAASGAADAAGDATDIAGMLDPLSFLGF